MLALVRIAVGVIFLFFAEYKIVGSEFVHGGFQKYITTFVDQIRSVKPSGVKGNYVKSITVSATMSPGIPVSV